MDHGQPLREGSTVLVTGAAGFIGSHAAERLIDGGYRVVGLDNFCDFYDRRWKENNLRSISPAVEVQEIDVVDSQAIDRLVRTARPAAILHLAAMAGVRPSIEQPAYYARVNLEGTTHLLEAARRHGVGRFVFASSSSVYGNAGGRALREENEAGAPVSPYGATKRAGELICHAFAHLYGLSIACLRLFTVYGPRQRPDLAIHKFVRLIQGGQPIPVYGDGSTSRDYTYVDDTVAGIIAATHHAPPCRYRIYNIGTGRSVSLSRLIEAIETATGRPAIIDRQPPQSGDVEHTLADISRACQELAFAPRVSLAQGLERFVDWFGRYGHLYTFPESTAAAAIGEDRGQAQV